MPKIIEARQSAELTKPDGYSHACEVQGGKTLYMAGQVALDREGQRGGQG